MSVPAPDGVATLGEVFRRIDELGVELADISLRKPSLDEVFLHLTVADRHRMTALAALTERVVRRARCATPTCCSRSWRRSAASSASPSCCAT